MEFIKFIPWLWKRYDDGERTLIGIFIISAIVLPSMHVWGLTALYVAFAALFGGFILFLLTLLTMSIRNNWRMYKEEKQREADAVASKLRGDYVPYRRGRV